MRQIIHELPYERPLLAGQLRYARDGRPTGAVESWRLTDAVDGYRFLRVDLDARKSSGRSWLYHVTLDPAGLPEQIKLRFWGDGLEVSGTVVWHDGELIATRTVNGAAYESVAHGAAFWFPAGSGLALLAGCAGETRGLTLVAHHDDPAQVMALVKTPVEVAWGESEVTPLDGEEGVMRPLSVTWGDNRRVVWLDTEGRPLRLWRDDGLTAAAERLVRYTR